MGNINIRLIMGLIMTCYGAYAVTFSWFKSLKVKKSQSWPKVSGEITRSEVTSHRARTGKTRNTIYTSSIEYKYEVNGQSYINSTICIGGMFNTSMPKRAEDRCAKYPQGSTVSVYYNPKKPNESCLEKRGEASWFTPLIGGIFFILGLLIATGVVGK